MCVKLSGFLSLKHPQINASRLRQESNALKSFVKSLLSLDPNDEPPIQTNKQKSKTNHEGQDKWIWMYDNKTL